MAHTEFKIQQRAYEEGLRAGRKASNPYIGTARQGAWNCGHRDRWVNRIKPGFRLLPFLIKMMLATGTAAIIISSLNAYYAQP